MKKLIVSFALIACTSFAFAQNDLDKNMLEKIEELSNTEQADDLGAIASEFDQMIANNDSWITYYYAAYAYVKQGRAMVNSNKLMEVDNIAATAEKYALVAQEKNPDTAEVPILLKMIHSLRIMVDPEKRLASETAAGNKFLEKAIELDPKNPRIAIAKAQDLYFIPKEFGGSKEKGLKMYQVALDQYKSYKPKANAVQPNWGQEEANFFITESKK